MRYAHLGILVATDLEELGRRVEDAVGVGHLFGTDQAFAGKVGSRSDVLVDHRVGASGTILVVAHLFADAVLEPVGRPRLALGDVVVHAAFQREEAAAVGLRARQHAELLAPFGVGDRETVAEHFGFRQLDVVAHAVDHLLELGGHLRGVVVVGDVAHAAGLEHRVLQVGHDVVAAPLFEFGGEIARPVRTLEFHRVGEQRTDVVAQRAELILDRIGHVVQVLFDGRLVEVVQRRPLCAGGAADHRAERVDAHQRVECVFAFGDIDREGPLFVDLVAQVDHLVEAAERFGNQLQREQVRHASFIGLADGRVGLLEQREDRCGVLLRSFELFDADDHHLAAFVSFEELAAERPARAYDQVAGHVEFLGLVESHGEHVDPLLAQPRQRLCPEVVGSARELDGVDLHAADTGILEQVQLAAQFVGVHLVAVPPPPHEGAVLGIGIAELLVVSVAVCAARIAFGRCSRSRLWGGCRCEQACQGEQHVAYGSVCEVHRYGDSGCRITG